RRRGGGARRRRAPLATCPRGRLCPPRHARALVVGVGTVLASTSWPAPDAEETQSGRTTTMGQDSFRGGGGGPPVHTTSGRHSTGAGGDQASVDDCVRRARTAARPQRPRRPPPA